MVAKREPRPSPRAGVTWEVRVGGEKLFLRTGEYSDGRLCEVFLDPDIQKYGTFLQVSLRSFAINLSIAVQHGAPLSELLRAHRHAKADPCGPVSGDPEIKWASSLFDYVAQRLERTYLGIKPDKPNGEPDQMDRVVQAGRVDPAPPEKVAGRYGKGTGV